LIGNGNAAEAGFGWLLDAVGVAVEEDGAVDGGLRE
jgi:hypothetical protein